MQLYHLNQRAQRILNVPKSYVDNQAVDVWEVMYYQYPDIPHGAGTYDKTVIL